MQVRKEKKEKKARVKQIGTKKDCVEVWIKFLAVLFGFGARKQLLVEKC